MRGVERYFVHILIIMQCYGLVTAQPLACWLTQQVSDNTEEALERDKSDCRKEEDTIEEESKERKKQISAMGMNKSIFILFILCV